MKKLILSANKDLTANQKIQVDQTVSKLYTAFDLDGNGILDYQEVSAALVILCKGSIEAKIKYGLEAFSELDKPGHVVITMKNFKRFMLCIFKLALEFKSEILLDYDLEKLSDQVAVKCF